MDGSPLLSNTIRMSCDHPECTYSTLAERKLETDVSAIPVADRGPDCHVGALTASG